MATVVVGLDHRSAPAELVERMALAGGRLTEALDLLAKSNHITESVVLSTCMRTEVYVEAVRFHGAVADVRSTLSVVTGVPHAEICDSAFEYFDESAWKHLFRVSAGLESAVVGEGEVLGQLVRAWDTARDRGSARSILNALFRHAVATGKRARSETGIGRGVTSIGQAAVAMAEERVGGLGDKAVLLVGAGQMGEGMALTLERTAGVSELFVCNRTAAKADDLAARLGAASVPFGSLGDAMRTVDVVLASTGAEEPVIDLATVERVMQERNERPLVFVDMGVPRDVDARVESLSGVTVLDMETLRRYADNGRAERLAEVEAVEAVIDEELRAYVEDVTARSVAPVVRGMRERAELIRMAEIERLASRLGPLTSEQRDALDHLTRSMVAKLLHEPTVRLKRSAGSPEGERMAEAMRTLMGL